MSRHGGWLQLLSAGASFNPALMTMPERKSDRIYFGTIKEGIEPPNLIEVQLNSYVDFLQKDVPFAKRKNYGLQAVFKEVFPIESYDEKAVLDFSHYEIGEPKLSALEAQREGQTYRDRKSTRLNSSHDQIS